MTRDELAEAIYLNHATSCCLGCDKGKMAELSCHAYAMADAFLAKLAVESPPTDKGIGKGDSGKIPKK